MTVGTDAEPSTLATDPNPDPNPAPAGPGRHSILLALLLYGAVLAGMVLAGGRWDPRTQLPATLYDPLQHLWVLRWTAGALQGQHGYQVCPDVAYPAGVSIGNFTPLHLQSLLFLALRPVLGSDVLTYNALWAIGFLTTALGTAWLAWRVTRSRPAAFFAGLAAMLSGPMIGRACGHLELMYVGTFALFLASWIDLVDAPTRRRMLTAAACYLLMGLSAAYFLVYAVIPAALYVAWAGAASGSTDAQAWLRARSGALIGFGTLVGLPLIGLFTAHLWAARHGYTAPRAESAFLAASTPLWGYLLPLPSYRFEPWFPVNPYRTPGVPGRPDTANAYLGLATLGLLLYAAGARVRFARRSFWWVVLISLVVLSRGAYLHLAGHAIPLPALWIRKVFIGFRLIREVDRFHLFAMVVACVVASAGLAHLLGRLRRPAWQALALLGVLGLTVADLGRTWHGTPIPSLPPCYGQILAHDPQASFLEVNDPELESALGYWQSLHGGRTSASFSGLSNVRHVNQVALNSPFRSGNLVDPNFLASDDPTSFDLLTQATFADQAPLFLHASDLRYVVVHRLDAKGQPWTPTALPRLEAKLAAAGALVFEDDRTRVYARDRLPLPSRPSLIATRGWRAGWDGTMTRMASRRAELAVYRPEGSGPVRIGLQAQAAGHDRMVSLVDPGGAVLARWRVGAGRFDTHESPALDLPAGLNRLALVSDGESRLDRTFDGLDPGPVSLTVQRLTIRPEPGPEPRIVPATASRSEATTIR